MHNDWLKLIYGIQKYIILIKMQNSSVTTQKSLLKQIEKLDGVMSFRKQQPHYSNSNT